ncbi:ORF6N domain-containing protein [uncultured Fibrobacter sp.]|uniref:ORF6N domain-containing protein n=1 Tax=uncultured Fibrobacter sp. TaxID=261512 RepID=UPI002805EFCE|nr:ORF6N domain-containing protein [uncultured Fibrobacter sp.]
MSKKKDEKKSIKSVNPLEESGVEKMIQVIRGKQVLLDRDLAILYGVETKVLNQAVKRNIERFPERNCFQLTKEEFTDKRNLKSQFVTSSWGGTRKLPYAFTEQGVAMLASVLRSETAVQVSLQIMDAFVAMRHFMMQNGCFVNRLSNVETKIIAQEMKILDHDHKIDEIFEAMDRGEIRTKGLFYNNQEFDAYVFVCSLIRQAKKRIILVDRYVDEKTLAMMLKREKGVSVTIYTYDKSKVFEVDLASYNAQYTDCPIEILPSYGMHDRFLFIDDTAYHFGASLKDLGKNTFFFTQEDFTLDEVLKKSNEIADKIS